MRIAAHDERIGVRLPADELRRIRLAADAIGMSVSEFMRMSAREVMDVLPAEHRPPVRTALRSRPGT